jgi:hypothetical protein
MEWWEYSEFRERGVPFALDAQGNWREVDAVSRGKACGCFCPDCKGPLIARQGDFLVHHFAHDGRRECRHALEASLYGMAINLLTKPGALLMLPSADPLGELEGELAVTPDERALLAVASLAPTGLLRIDSAQARTTSLQASAADLPDLVFPRQQIAIHMLSHRKSRAQAAAAPYRPDTHVVGLNLRAYAKLWWRICEEDQATTLRVASEARELLREWLATETAGRGWLHHPALERAVAEIRARIETTRADRHAAIQRELLARQAAERRELEAAEKRRHEAERIWRIPPSAAGAAPDQGMMKAATPEAHSWLTHSLAVDFRVEWHQARRQYFFVGQVGELVTELAREVLDPRAPWEPISPADDAAFADPPPPVFPTESLPFPRPHHEPLPLVVDRPDEVLRTVEKKCWCGTLLQEVRLGSGVFASKRVLRCATNPKHPMIMLGP